jgi:hypothetical protein
MTDVTPPSGPPGPSGARVGGGDELTPEELACGYLDGELEADDRARVEADPTLMALVAELRAVSDAVAAPVAPLTDDERAAMVAAAIATLPSFTDVGEPENASVASLDAARARRSGRLVRTVAGGLAAAAAVGLVALVVTRGGSNRDQSTADGTAATAALEAAAGGAEATTADAATADVAPAETTAAAAEAPASEAPGSEAPAGAAAGASSTAPALSTAADSGTERTIPDLGRLANRGEARSATTGFAFVPAPPPDGAGPCAGYPPPVATATFQGAPAYVVIIEVAPDGNRLAFLDQVTCAVLVKVDPANA